MELFEQTPTLASAYVPRTLLTAIFDHSPDRATAQTRLQLWTERVKPTFRTLYPELAYKST